MDELQDGASVETDAPHDAGYQTKIKISGKVQGVFFRDFIKQNSNKLGLRGYAKNLRDGTVLAVVQGSKKEIQSLIMLCWNGPMFAKVDKIESLEVPADEVFEFFDIR